jgi:hypothetical protein
MHPDKSRVRELLDMVVDPAIAFDNPEDRPPAHHTVKRIV